MSDDRILLFIPCYNCEKQVGRVLAQIDATAAAALDEVLVIDNRSSDGTVDAAIRAMEGVTGCKVTVARNVANYNLGGSHKAAFAYARAQGHSHVAVLHGDDQGRFADMLPILAAGLHRTQDACLGSRFARGAKLVNYSAFRIFGNHVFNALFTVAAGKRITDLGSGLNIFGRRVIEDGHVFRWADDLRFNIYLLLGMIEQRMAIGYFPISWREEDQVSNVKMTSQALKTVEILRDFLFARRKFMVDDHRAMKHEDYRFEVIAERV